MAVEDFGGKVLGRKIEIVSGDDQNKPDVGLGVVRRWFDVENVVMVTGLGNSGVALAIQNLARERKRVDIVEMGQRGVAKTPRLVIGLAAPVARPHVVPGFPG